MKLKNRTIWEAADAAQAVGQLALPVKTALAIARLGVKLNDLKRPLDKVRLQKIHEYAVLDEHGSPKKEGGNFVMRDEAAWRDVFNEMLDGEAEIDGVLEKVKLPEMVAATCDKCKHNMDKALQIPPVLLMPLLDFIEM